MKKNFSFTLLATVLFLAVLTGFASANQTCSETDNGRDRFNHGILTGGYYSNVGYNHGPLTDYCIESGHYAGHLVEYFCSTGDSVQYNTIECLDGCQDGACIQTSSAVCTDSDNGKDYSERATVSVCSGGDCIYYEDECVENSLKEYYCTNNELDQIVYGCSYGCNNGACGQPDLFISFATLKDYYVVDENISLTDPPEIIVLKETPKIHLIEFEDEPVLSIQKKLKKQAKDAEEFIEEYPILSTITTYRYWALTSEEVPGEVRDYSRKLDEIHEEMKDEIVKQLSKKQLMSGSAAVDSDNLNIIRKSKEVINGIKLNLTSKQVEVIKDVNGVKTINPDVVDTKNFLNVQNEVFIEDKVVEGFAASSSDKRRKKRSSSGTAVPSLSSEENNEDLKVPDNSVIKQGVLEAVVVENFEEGWSETQYFLNVNNIRYRLYFDDEISDEDIGRTLRINGEISGEEANKEIVVFSSNVVFDDAPAFHDDSAMQAMAGTVEERVAVVKINFLNDMSQSLSDAEALSTMSEVNDFYVNNSFGRINLNTNVYGDYTLNMDATCNDGKVFFNIINDSDISADINWLEVDRLLIVFPWNGECGWAGIASSGKSNYNTSDGMTSISYSILNGPSGWTSRIVAHELGHNFGLGHANFLDCGNEVIKDNFPNNCLRPTYGDSFDVMGNSFRNLNAIHLEQLGWLEDSQILELGTSGEYSVEPIATDTGGVKALKIFRENDGYPYYFEFRRFFGYDESDFEDYDGALMHINYLYTSGSFRSLLLDTSPGDGTSRPKDVVLRKGKTFYDLINGIVVTTLNFNDDGLDLDVVFLDERPQSKIVNSEAVDISGYLNISIQKKNGEVWTDYSQPISETVVIPANDLIKLDLMFNPTNALISEAGTYRVYASFDYSSGIISSNWEFKVDAYTCVDSDGGQDYWTSGFTSACLGDRCTDSYDYCFSGEDGGVVYEYVLEYSCENSQANSANWSFEWCPGGCSGGACV